MKRLLIPIAVLAFAGCQDAAFSPEAGTPSFAVSDGAHGAQATGGACVDGSSTWPQCQSFYFFPPIVEEPSPTGTANGTLMPSIIITQLPMMPDPNDPTGQTMVPDDSQLSCVATLAGGGVNVIREFSPSEISVDANGDYSVGYNTGEDNLTVGAGYRICVRIPRSDGGFWDMGFRDIQPDDSGADVPRNTAQLPLYQFNNGRSFPIKFRIEQGALCGLEDNIDCTEGVLGPDGGTLICDDARCGLSVPPGALDEGTLFFVELVTCPRDADGQITHLGIETDVPLGPGCLEVTTPDDPDFGGFNIAATVGACVDLGAFPGLKPEQDELLQLLHARPNGDGTVTGEFLPQVPFPGDLDCLGFAEMASARHPLLKLASRGLRAVQTALLPWVNPQPLHAVDQGFGGGKLLQTSPFVWGLPTQFERGMLSSTGQFIPWTDPEIGEVGGTLTPAIRALDGGDPTCDPTAGTCFEQQTVENATIWFDVVGGGGSVDLSGAMTIEDFFSGKTKVVTDANGIAAPGWTLGEDNPNLLEAHGVGIGCFEFDDDGDGNADCEIRDGLPPQPPVSADGTGTFGDAALTRPRERVDIARGVITFEALACAPGATVDGAIGANEYPTANSESFMAQVPGGEVPATLYWTNDCDNLYVALRVQTTDLGDNVSWRLVFDNDGDGVPAADDDILFLERVVDKKTKISTWVFEDRFLTADCLNSSQSDCGASDVSAGGTNDGQGAFGAEGTFGVYEVSHPLMTGDVGHDFQLAVGNPATCANCRTAYYIVLQLGSGAKANNEWRGFRDYIPVEITGSGGF